MDHPAEYEIFCAGKEWDEDGWYYTQTMKMVCKSFEDCRGATKFLAEKCEIRGGNWHWNDRQWVCQSGKTRVWHTTFTIVVDAQEEALERQNHYIASMREDPREEEMERQLEAEYEWNAEAAASDMLDAQIGIAF